LDGGGQSHIMILPQSERLCKCALKWAGYPLGAKALIPLPKPRRV
jgi:hypothetical protein